MNKNVINQEIRLAYVALAETKIADAEGTIVKTYRGQISSFGAAITMGSLLPAIAFFSKDGDSDVSRSKLMDAVLLVLKKSGKTEKNVKNLFEYAESGDEDVCKEEILNATIALKLAMNLYNLK